MEAIMISLIIESARSMASHADVQLCISPRLIKSPHIIIESSRSMPSHADVQLCISTQVQRVGTLIQVPQITCALRSISSVATRRSLQ